MRLGAVGDVRMVEQHGRSLVEKRLTDPVRRDTEVHALRALAPQGLPLPELIELGTESIPHDPHAVLPRRLDRRKPARSRRQSYSDPRLGGSASG